MSAASEIDRMHALVDPIASDLALDVYDIERRGATIRITLDTSPGSEGGITSTRLSLATRLISRELDHDDPIAGQYTLEVTSPGLERQLRTPAHFQREVGKTISVRLRDPARRPRGCRDRSSPPTTAAPRSCSTTARERTVVITEIDKARDRVRVGPQAQARQAVGQAIDEEGQCQGIGRNDSESDIDEGEATVMSNLDMSEAIGMLAQEKGISEDTLLHVLVDALASAYKRRPDAADEVVVEVEPRNHGVLVHRVRRRRGRQLDQRARRHAEEGRARSHRRADLPSGDEPAHPRGRAERKFEEYANREGDIVTGIIQQTDARYTLLDLGRVEALLPQAEQVPFERPGPGDASKAYIVEVRRPPRARRSSSRRTHPGLIKRLFELEVPEIADGIVEIKACAREPGPPHQDRRLVERPQRRPGRRVRRRPRWTCPHGRQRAARREDRHRALQRGSRRLRRQGTVAGEGHPGDHHRGRHRRPT